MTNDLINNLADTFVATVIERITKDEKFVKALVESETFKTAVFKGLEQHIDEHIEASMSGIEIDADQVNNLDRAIESSVEEAVNSISADEIDGLDRAIESAIESELENHTVEASSIEGLESAITDVISADRDIQFALKKAVLDGLTVTVDAKIDGKSIEGVAVEAAH